MRPILQNPFQFFFFILVFPFFSTCIYICIDNVYSILQKSFIFCVWLYSTLQNSWPNYNVHGYGVY